MKMNIELSSFLKILKIFQNDEDKDEDKTGIPSNITGAADPRDLGGPKKDDDPFSSGATTTTTTTATADDFPIESGKQLTLSEPSSIITVGKDGPPSAPLPKGISATTKSEEDAIKQKQRQSQTQQALKITETLLKMGRKLAVDVESHTPKKGLLDDAHIQAKADQTERGEFSETTIAKIRAQIE